MDKTTEAFHDWIFSRLSRSGPKTQSGLAAALNVAHPQISMLKQGERDLKVREVPLIASYLQVPPPPWPSSIKARDRSEVIAVLRQIDIPDAALEPVWAFISGYLKGVEQPQQDLRNDQSEPATPRRVKAPSE